MITENSIETCKEIEEKMSLLYGEYLSIKNQIEELQNQCSHPEKDVVFHHSDNGSLIGPRWTCKSCKRITGYPTVNDLIDAGYDLNLK